MKNFTKLGMIISCIVCLSVMHGFAQVDNQQINIGNPEFSQMDKDQDGLMSCTEMQTNQPGLFTNADFGEMDTNDDGMVSKAEYATYLNISH